MRKPWWTTEFGGDYDRAKKVIDGPMPGKQVANVSGVQESMISNYRTGKRDLAQARWETVAKLARVHDAELIHDEIESQEGVELIVKVDDILGQLAELCDDAKMARAIYDVVMTDPMALVYIKEITNKK